VPGGLPAYPRSRDDAVIDKTVCGTVLMLNTRSHRSMGAELEGSGE
jgi:hypothetical protein